MERIETLLSLYTSATSPLRGKWGAAALTVATGKGKGSGVARALCKEAWDFIDDRSNIPTNPYGRWCQSLLEEDEDFADGLRLHLQTKGKYVKAEDIVEYTGLPEVQERHGLKKAVSIATARRWMNTLGYRWRLTFRGQYVDGHEREDVVYYREKTFLPMWDEIKDRQRHWNPDGSECPPDPAKANLRRVVVWYHDESTFYAHDRRRSQWVNEAVDAPSPHAKGEGHSLMVCDFVSADYGWLRSKDGKDSARVLFKAGKARDGWFTNEDILAQAKKALAILRRDNPDEDHVLVYDNATTHTKRAEDALSARKMPKGTSKTGNWLLETMVVDEDGEVQTVKAKMRSGYFRDGTPQSFYFPDDHPTHSGIFKGMEVILTERGYIDVKKLRYECKGFKCKPQTAIEGCCSMSQILRESNRVWRRFVRPRALRLFFYPSFTVSSTRLSNAGGMPSASIA